MTVFTILKKKNLMKKKTSNAPRHDFLMIFLIFGSLLAPFWFPLGGNNSGGIPQNEACKLSAF
jgi:hypothetical protein